MEWRRPRGRHGNHEIVNIVTCERGRIKFKSQRAPQTVLQISCSCEITHFDLAGNGVSAVHNVGSKGKEAGESLSVDGSRGGRLVRITI